MHEVGGVAVDQFRRLPAPSPFEVRNRELENHLDSLVGTQSILTVITPAGSGALDCIVSWLRHSEIERYPTCIESSFTFADRFDVVAQVREVALTLCGTNPPTLAWATRAQRRASARILDQQMTGDAIFIVNRTSRILSPHTPPATPSSSAVAEADQNDPDRDLNELITECRRLTLVLVDDDDSEPSLNSRNSPFRQPLDPIRLTLTSATLRSEAVRLGVPLPGEVENALLSDFAGSSVIAARYFEAVIRSPINGGPAALLEAHTTVLMDATLALLGAEAFPCLALLALLESTTGSFIGEIVSDHDLTSDLDSLARRGLLEVTRATGQPAVFRLGNAVREYVRAATIRSYLDNRLKFHIAASSASDARGDLREAVQHLLLLELVDAALQLFCGRWDVFLRDRGHRPLLELCDLLPRDAVLSHLEVLSIFSLISALGLDSDSIGRFSKRLSSVRVEEIGALDLRGRLTVRAALTRVMVDEGRLPEARATIADATSDLERARFSGRRALAGVYSEYLLSAARYALLTGNLYEAHRLFEDSAGAARSSRDNLSAARASTGLALCSALTADFDLGQHQIDLSKAQIEGTNSASPTATINVAWAQILLWEFVGAWTQLHGYSKVLAAHTRQDTRWRILSLYVEAVLLASTGQYVAATDALRHLDGFTLGGTQLPLFHDKVSVLLALMAVLSNRLTAGISTLSLTPSSGDHALCFNAFRGLLEAGRGNPAEALHITEQCLALASSHSKLMLPYVYLSRSIAFGMLGRAKASEEAREVAVAIAAASSQHIFFNAILSRFSGEVDDPAPASTRPLLRVPRPGAEAVPAALTPKERLVLSHLGRDETLAVIASHLFVSENTLKSHTRSIYRKLGVTSRQEATDRASLWGLS